MVIWNILRTFGIFMAIWYILCSFGTAFPVLVSRTKKNLASLIHTWALDRKFVQLVLSGRKTSMTAKALFNHGDQIGRIFAHWVTGDFGQFYEN
jgi:hypothetical protein